MSRTRAEIQKEIDALNSELSSTEDGVDVAKILDGEEKKKPGEGRKKVLEEEIASASEDSLHEVAELLRELLGKKTRAKDVASMSERIDQWLKR